MAWKLKGRAATASETESAWRRALRAATARDWPATETWLERIVEGDSKDLDAYLALARVYRAQGAVGRALRMHQNLLLRSEIQGPDRAEALLELARDFEAGGFKARAVASYEEVLAMQPRNAELLERLVSLLHELGEYERALALTRRLRRRDRAAADSHEVEILLSQARSQVERGDHQDARKSVKSCLRRDKNSASAWMILGELEAERGKTSRALDAWKRGAMLDAAVAAELYAKLGATFAAVGKPEAHDAFLLEILEARPEDRAARIALARARGSRGESTLAVEELARAIELAPERIELRAELGRQLIASGQEAEALKAYAELLDVIERLPVAAESADVETVD